jgi:toxin secretion/phage lysis holin
MKIIHLIMAFIGTVGSILASLFGGWDAALKTLLIFMAIDFITGLIVGGVFHNSTKTQTGTLESKASFKGLCRKGTILLFVLIGTRLDLAFDCDYIRNGICIAYIFNELLSIVENAGLMGLPIPKVLTNAIDVLKSKVEKEGAENGN